MSTRWIFIFALLVVFACVFGTAIVFMMPSSIASADTVEFDTSVTYFFEGTTSTWSNYSSSIYSLPSGVSITATFTRNNSLNTKTFSYFRLPGGSSGYIRLQPSSTGYNYWLDIYRTSAKYGYTDATGDHTVTITDLKITTNTYDFGISISSTTYQQTFLTVMKQVFTPDVPVFAVDTGYYPDFNNLGTSAITVNNVVCNVSFYKNFDYNENDKWYYHEAPVNFVYQPASSTYPHSNLTIQWVENQIWYRILLIPSDNNYLLLQKVADQETLYSGYYQSYTLVKIVPIADNFGLSSTDLDNLSYILGEWYDWVDVTFSIQDLVSNTLIPVVVEDENNEFDYWDFEPLSLSQYCVVFNDDELPANVRYSTGNSDYFKYTYSVYLTDIGDPRVRIYGSTFAPSFDSIYTFNDSYTLTGFSACFDLTYASINGTPEYTVYIFDYATDFLNPIVTIRFSTNRFNSLWTENYSRTLQFRHYLEDFADYVYDSMRDDVYRDGYNAGVAYGIANAEGNTIVDVVMAVPTTIKTILIGTRDENGQYHNGFLDFNILGLDMKYVFLTLVTIIILLKLIGFIIGNIGGVGGLFNG